MLREVNLPDPETDDRPLSAPAVGRPAAARGDRHGADGRAVAAGDGRADHRPRRHGRSRRARPGDASCARSTTPPSSSSATISAPWSRICDRIGVMYAGELVEEGPITEVFRNPRHPYTRGLLSCIPTLGADKHSAPLMPIPGQVPPALNRPQGLRLPAALQVARAGPLQPGPAADARHAASGIASSACGRSSCRT